MTHHTKDKGDLGVAKAHGDLVAQGFLVLFPMTEHAPFDLVTYRDGVFERIQVKYRSMRLGAVEARLQSSWADGHGVHTQPIDKSKVDVICIYCPESDECYYVRPAAHATLVTLRLQPSRNNQRSGVLFASDFRTMPAPVGKVTSSPSVGRIRRMRRDAGEAQLMLWETSA